MNLTHENKIAVLKLHLAIAFVDNNYSAEEEKFIGKLCKKFEIDFKTRVLITKEISSSKKSMPEICREELKRIQSKDLQKECLTTLAQLCAADFMIYEDELLLLQLVAEEWGMYIEK